LKLFKTTKKIIFCLILYHNLLKGKAAESPQEIVMDTTTISATREGEGCGGATRNC